ncbi:Secreted protein containing C-terminal beta-propeller domain [Anaerovirgula multivorans]|uniref:Secreted protein containing C-terminal beta-propeller domain n=1 Tax=Anaerovirgula multivorans TaxID=312168 RepID=A0A239BE02_9FIRM|nr:beta-propeller domain-containing protein [Anaerovirgula multivorans]SNS05324.1 Secreted protein containing C-terminal beta-propeller domain [Anaerovirgula multivorans]
MKRRGYILPIVFGFFSMFLVAYGFTHSDITVDHVNSLQTVDNVNDLPTIGSLENFKLLLEEYDEQQELYFADDLMFGLSVDISRDSGSFKESTALQDSASGGDYSSTNVQVQGVDEADIVKTDGKYIYQINDREIIIIDTQTPAKLEVINKIAIDDKTFQPTEMYLGDSYLAVIGYSYDSIKIPQPIIYDSAEPASERAMIASYYPTNTVHMKLYDIKDKKNVKKEREIALEGSYVSSRLINDNIYVVTNNNIGYRIMESKDSAELTPHYKDSLLGDEIEKVDFKDIRYFPDAIEPNYITIMGLNLGNFKNKATIYTYLGRGENIYASLENLYIAVNKYEYTDQTTSLLAPRERVPAYTNDTEIYKFELNKGEVQYQNKGKVPGRILNQFSMDENQGYFRIATTTGNIWRTDEFTSKNNVYILDQQMKITGRLEDIAPTERIYAMRFMGNRGYMVTFRETDPFYVIDLEDPQAPKILGYLKIPGYSDYLHPYDENHIIGFGKEVVETKGNTLQAGMKVAVFDVQNVNQPIEKFKVEIGDRGTESPLLTDHKALLFSKEKNLLAFPVTIVENKSGTPNEWGQFAFQGAYIYHLDMTDGFNLKGGITHLAEEDYQKAGSYWYDSEKNVSRVLYIGDQIYTLSNAKIKAHQLSTMNLTSEILLK